MVTIPGPDVITGSHPIFKVLTGEENPFIDTVFVNHYYPLDEKWLETEKAESQARVIVSLRNKQPLFLEHSYGDGRVITCLTAAGTLTGKDGLIWSNWASGPAAPSYAVMQLELTKHIARRDRILPRRIVGEPIREVLPPAVYRDEVEVISPDGQQSRLKAASERPPEPPVPGEPPPAPAPLIVIHAETDAPGVFTVVVQTQDRNEERRLYAYNVPPEESRLELATEQQIRKLVGDDVPLQIQAPGQFDWLRARPAGQEMRWWILAALLLLFVCEQALALRLSYHPV